MYAQNLRNKKEELLERGMEVYASEDEWLYHLHRAIYLGNLKGKEGQYVWHATGVAGGTALWTIEKFQHFYKPVSVKRVLP